MKLTREDMQRLTDIAAALSKFCKERTEIVVTAGDRMEPSGDTRGRMLLSDGQKTAEFNFYKNKNPFRQEAGER